MISGLIAGIQFNCQLPEKLATVTRRQQSADALICATLRCHLINNQDIIVLLRRTGEESDQSAVLFQQIL